MTDPSVEQRFLDVLREFERRRLPLPALTIDGHIVEMEWFSAWGVVDAVEEWLAARQAVAAEPSL